MLRSIKLQMSVVMLCLTISSSSCASSQIVSPPQLKGRTLRLSLDGPWLEYQYEKCVETFLGRCVKSTWQVDIYDLLDPRVRKELTDLGFVVKIREVLY